MPISSKPPVFAGYYPKTLFEPGWDNVRWVCSVSECLSQGPDFDNGEWWTFNRLKFYNTIELATAAGEEGATIFAYWIYPVAFVCGQEPDIIDVPAHFFADLPDLPEQPPDGDWTVLGYDFTVYGGPQMAHWGCSRITCSGEGLDRANAYGLLDSLEEAFQCADPEVPEDGEVFVFRVEVRESDRALLEGATSSA